MYRNSKNIISPFSKSPQNSSVKIPCGTPLNCKFKVISDNSGQACGEFVFSIEKIKRSSAVKVHCMVLMAEEIDFKKESQLL